MTTTLDPISLYRLEKDKRYESLMLEATVEFQQWDQSKEGKKERKKQYGNFRLNKKSVVE